MTWKKKRPAGVFVSIPFVVSLELKEKTMFLYASHRDAFNAERRSLQMVRIEKDYVFEGPNGKASLLDLFEGRLQLITYHFMWLWKAGEPLDKGARAARPGPATSPEATSRICTPAVPPWLFLYPDLSDRNVNQNSTMTIPSSRRAPDRLTSDHNPRF